MSRIRIGAIATLTVLLATVVALEASARRLFELRANTTSGPAVIVNGDDANVIDLVDDFIKGNGDYAPIGVVLGATGRLDYLGVRNAIQIDTDPYLGGTARATLRIRPTGTVQVFTGSDPDAVVDAIEDWIENDGADEWADFLREINGLSPLAVLSGNPKSTVALMGDSAYRKFGYDDSRSRFGFGEKKVQRIGGAELRIDASGGSVNVGSFDDDLATFDGAITLAGQFGRYVGLSGSVIGQYRNYNDSEMADLGLELALPLTFLRPDTSAYFWQITPFAQAAGGASIDAAAGGLFVGGGVVNGIARHWSGFELLMSNEIAYYDGIPIDEIVDYDFDTKLSQWFFKNGIEGTAWLPLGFYADLGLHCTNFAGDDAAVPWYVTPTVGVGWQAGRWMDIRIAYEGDFDDENYRSHNAVLKLDFLF